ncbi:MAG: isoprenylcysteine carboxylmethyltransferase family protein [bacterium]|nr:isoprenylcysteine carboxylmethyltransferase family protein [bacterium]
MNRREPDRAAVRFPPVFVFLLAVGAGVLLDRLLLPLPLGLPELVRVSAAWGAALFGTGFIVTALALFHRTRQDPEPWKSTPEMIFKGPYRMTRNPMYLGMALLQGAAGLWKSNGWIIGLLPLALLGVYLIAIRPEEVYLERKFGDAYRDYRARVRRWL